MTKFYDGLRPHPRHRAKRRLNPAQREAAMKRWLKKKKKAVDSAK